MDIDNCFVVWDDEKKKILSVHTLKSMANALRSELIEIEKESDPNAYMRYQTPSLAHAITLVKNEAQNPLFKPLQAFHTGDGCYCPIDTPGIAPNMPRALDSIYD